MHYNQSIIRNLLKSTLRWYIVTFLLRDVDTWSMQCVRIERYMMWYISQTGATLRRLSPSSISWIGLRPARYTQVGTVSLVVTGEQQVYRKRFPALFRRNWYPPLHFYSLYQSTTGLPTAVTPTFKKLSTFRWSILYLFPKFHENQPIAFWVIMLTNKQRYIKCIR